MSKMVTEKIDAVFTEREEISYENFNDKIESLYKNNMHKSYESFSITLEFSKQLKAWTLFFNGCRPETKEECKKREAEEAARQKTVEAAELKEYLRLKKKYGKKEPK